MKKRLHFLWKRKQTDRKNMVKSVIKFSLALSIAAGIFSVSFCSYAAEGVNENEQAIIQYLESGFHYGGKSYKVDNVYMSEFKAYVALDHIDITAEQKEQVISKVNANVQTGIEYGILTPLTEADKEDTGKDQEDYKPDTDKDNMFEDPTISKWFGLDEVNKKREESVKDKKDKKKKEQITSTVIDQNAGTISVVNGQGESLFSTDMPIKNTGFNCNAIFYLMGILGILFLGTMVVVVRWRLFADEDE